MLSINPEMLPRDVSKVIELTAVEKGDPGKDPRYGTGRIDALAATTSPKFTLTGVNGGSNWLLNSTITASDTARELVGLKISTTINPQVGSLKKLAFAINTTATATHINSFILYWDKDNNNIVGPGDIKLKSIPFSTGVLIFDSLKFKFLDVERRLLLTAKTTSSASGQTVNLGMMDTNMAVAYYTTTAFSTNFPFGTVSSTKENTIAKIDYSLQQNYPNPFNPVTLIRYSITKDALVKINVYDVLGREIAVLVNNYKLAGNHSVEFDTKDFPNLSSGIYYYKMTSLDFSDVKTMLLLK